MPGIHSQGHQHSGERVPVNGQVAEQQLNGQSSMLGPREVPRTPLGDSTHPSQRTNRINATGVALRLLADQYDWLCSDCYAQALRCGVKLRLLADCFQGEYDAASNRTREKSIRQRHRRNK